MELHRITARLNIVAKHHTEASRVKWMDSPVMKCDSTSNSLLREPVEPSMNARIHANEASTYFVHVMPGGAFDVDGLE